MGSVWTGGNYIDFLESKIEKNISIISTGPDRVHTIDRNNLLDNI